MVGRSKAWRVSERANGLRIARGRLPSQISTNFIHDLHTNDLEGFGRKDAFPRGSGKEVCQLVACLSAGEATNQRKNQNKMSGSSMTRRSLSLSLSLLASLGRLSARCWDLTLVWWIIYIYKNLPRPAAVSIQNTFLPAPPSSSHQTTIPLFPSRQYAKARVTERGTVPSTLLAYPEWSHSHTWHADHTGRQNLSTRARPKTTASDRQSRIKLSLLQC
jgi:hypothetical protein